MFVCPDISRMNLRFARMDGNIVTDLQNIFSEEDHKRELIWE